MTNIVVPELGESVVEARVARWLKKEGDRVEVGEALVELETEKVDLEVNADKSGVLASITRQEGEDVKIGELLGVVDETQGTTSAESAKGAKSATSPSVPTSPAPAPVARSGNGSSGNGAEQTDLKATPTARRIAREHEIDLGAVKGSGPSGRVMKQDVAGALAKPAPAARTPSIPNTSGTSGTVSKDRTERRERMSKRRETIARRLVEAQHNAAMLTTFNEVDMTAIMNLRERRKEAFKKEYGVGLGIASFFVKASVAALRAFPQLNAEIQGNEIVYKDYFDIGMAVGAEGGLVVPVIRDADRKSFSQLELAIRDFAQRAVDGNLTLEDLKGGTFTITNGGVFGSLLSTPILNPPQVGILGLHKIQDRVVPVNGQPAIRPMMYVALSYDHRIVDGREAVQFLVKVKEFIEDPGHLLLES
jgi:2-oxoglutarate dehydrogenase E2 component (dihydrolipoamide succinyltransferase)